MIIDYKDEWCTPERYIEVVRLTFGGEIDLDPCSSEFAQQVVKAKRFFTKEYSCLDNPWTVYEDKPCSVFLNPPYSRGLINKVINKFINEINEQEDNGIEEAIVLVNNSSETKWFQELFFWCDAICFPNHRINFYHNNPSFQGKKRNKQGQVFFYFGKYSFRFVDRFSDFGVVFKKTGLLTFGRISYTHKH